MSIAERMFDEQVREIKEYLNEHGHVDSAKDYTIFWAYQKIKDLEEEVSNCIESGTGGI